MPVSRRSTLQTIGAVGGLALLSGTALAVGEHEDDERTPAANDDEINDDEITDDAAGIRVAHFSPDAPAVDVLIDDEQVLADFDYGDVSPYLAIAPGTYQVTITAAGDPDTVVFDDAVEFASAFYTVAAIGELGDDTFRPAVLVDAGSALVRLFHAAPDAPVVDVLADGEPLCESIAFEELTDYVAVPAGSYELSVTPADDPETVVASFDVDFELGTAYTANAIGYLEPPEEFSEREFTVEITVDGELDEVPDEDPAEEEPADEEPEEAPEDEGPEEGEPEGDEPEDEEPEEAPENDEYADGEHDDGEDANGEYDDGNAENDEYDEKDDDY